MASHNATGSVRHTQPISLRRARPTSYDGYECRAAVRAVGGDLDGALADATKAIELDASLARGHLTLGNVLHQMSRTAEAIPEYGKAIELDPSYANAYRQRSDAHAKLGDDEAAAPDLDKAIELEPGFAEAYADRAWLAAGVDDCQRAIRDADKAIQLAPAEFPTAYEARAVCRAYTGDLDGALADADLVIELGRMDAAAYYVRGSIRAERGDVPEARADLRRAIELAPTAEFANVIRALMSGYGLEWLPDGVKVPLDGFTGTDGPTAGFMFVLGDVVFDQQGGTRRIKLDKPVGPASNKIDATMTAEVIKGS